MSKTIQVNPSATHIFGFFALAVTQPLLDLLGGYPEFFDAHKLESGALIVWTLLLALATPLAVFVFLKAVQKFLPRLAGVLYAVLVFCLLTLAVLPLFRAFPASSGYFNIALAMLSALLLTFFYYLSPAVRLFSSLFSLLAVVSPLWFLLGAPSSRILKQTAVIVGAPKGEAENLPPLSMIIFDEFPLVTLLDESYQIDDKWFPNFARLAASSTWFRGASTVSTQTDNAIPAILSGTLRPADRIVRSAGNMPQSLFTLLASDYKLNVYETITNLCPSSLCAKELGAGATFDNLKKTYTDASAVYVKLIAPQQFSEKLPEINAEWDNFWALSPSRKKGEAIYEDRSQKFKNFIRSIQPTEKPSFNFMHVMLPHAPYCLLPSLRQYHPGKKYPHGLSEKRYWGKDEVAIQQAYERFLSQAIATDRMLGDLLDQLERQAIFDKSLVVVLADHGISFAPKSYYRGRKSEASYKEEVLPVPLFIKLPYQKEGVVSDRAVKSYDVMPTVAELIGFKANWRTQGRSMFVKTSDGKFQVKGEVSNDSSMKSQQIKPTVANVVLPGLNRIRWKTANFKIAQSPAEIGQTGPFVEIVTKSVSSFEKEQHASWRAELDNSARWADWDLEIEAASGEVPAFLTFEIKTLDDSNSPKGGVPFALAINDKLVSTSQSYRTEQGNVLCSFFIPEKHFSFGAKNHLTLYSIETPSGLSGSIVLKEIGRTGDSQRF